MLCKECNTDMVIISQSYEATGDTSADTATQFFTVPQFVCINPQCSKEGQSIEGEKIPLINTATSFIVEGGKYCCDTLLCFVRSDSFKVSLQDKSSIVLEGEILKINCPKCGELHQFNVKGKKNLFD